MPTILVADDNSNIHKMVELALKDLGYKIERVGNGEHAVTKLPEIKPDLILADIFMPVRNGYEVCEFVKTSELYQHIPVVLLQGKFDPLDEHLMKKVRADGLLMKPFVPPDPLVKMVQTLLEEAAATRATVEAAKARPGASPESTVEMTRAEIEALTGKKKEELVPEPEAADYATAKPQIDFGEGEQPLAFGELLGAPPEVEAAPGAVEPERLRSSSLEGLEVEAEAAIEEKPSWGGIEEELKKPSPDEPPIKVEFGAAEEMELVTEETAAEPSVVQAAPLEDLATTPDEFIASGPPKISVSEVAEESWTAAPPPETVVPVEEVAPPPPPAPEPMLEAKLEPVPEPVAPPQAYERPQFEEIPAPTPPMDQVPATAAPAPAVEPPPPPVGAPVAPAVERAVEAAARSFAIGAPIDPALVDAIVEKVLARLQPQIVEKLTRDVLRPLAEALLRKESEK